MRDDTSRADAGFALVIRQFTPADVAAVVEVIAASPEAASWSAESVLQLACAGGQILVAEIGDRITGFLAGRIAGPEYEILNLAVAPLHRRQGMGRELLLASLSAAKHAGCAQTYLEVRASNRAALALYARQGFLEIGRRRSYYREPEEDAALLGMALPPQKHSV